MSNLNTTDPRKWAKAFQDAHPNTDFGDQLVVWFANAIIATREEHDRQVSGNEERLKEVERRLSLALDIAPSGQVDGAHHKMHTIDQMVRALTGCRTEQRTGVDVNGITYTYETLGDSDEYESWVAAYCNGEDGPDTYNWETGTS